MIRPSKSNHRQFKFEFQKLRTMKSVPLKIWWQNWILILEQFWLNIIFNHFSFKINWFWPIFDWNPFKRSKNWPKCQFKCSKMVKNNRKSRNQSNFDWFFNIFDQIWPFSIKFDHFNWFWLFQSKLNFSIEIGLALIYFIAISKFPASNLYQKFD